MAPRRFRRCLCVTSLGARKRHWSFWPESSSTAFEAASPGGWVDYPEAQGDRWIFLAGDRSLVKNAGSEARRELAGDHGSEPNKKPLFLPRRPR